jgi:FMN-dependent NADH-azoreductase
VTRDLAAGIRPIDGTSLGAAYAPAEARSESQQATAAHADVLLDEVKAVAILVIPRPVCIFSRPAQLKAWID